MVEKYFEIVHKLCYSDACSVCFHELVANHIETIQHNEDLAIIAEKSKPGGKKYFISKVWFQEWKKKLPFDGNIPRPDEDRFARDVFCEHGSLSTNSATMIEISSTVYKLIQSRFSGFSTMQTTSTECELCVLANNENELSGHQIAVVESELVLT